MGDGRCLHPDVSELETAPLRLSKVAATTGGAELWRCSICAGWFVRLPATDLLDVTCPEGADVFVKHFAAWVTAEAARRKMSPDEVRNAVLGPREQPPRMIVRPAPSSEAMARAEHIGQALARMGVIDAFTREDLEELARVVSEQGPWSLAAILSSLPDEALARRRVIAPARALGTVDPWDVAERANEDTLEGGVSFVLVPAGDAGDLLPLLKKSVRVLATWEALRGEDRRRLARLASRLAS